MNSKVLHPHIMAILHFWTIFLLLIYHSTHFGILVAVLFTPFKHMGILKLIYVVEENYHSQGKNLAKANFLKTYAMKSNIITLERTFFSCNEKIQIVTCWKRLLSRGLYNDRWRRVRTARLTTYLELIPKENWTSLLQNMLYACIWNGELSLRGLESI